MKQIVKYLIVATMLTTACITDIEAQSLERFVIGSTGGFAEVGSLQLSATAGEAVIATGQSGSFILTQGFQQPDSILSTGIQPIDISIDYRLYPNPTTDMVRLELNSGANWHAGFRLTDAAGKLIAERTTGVNSGMQTEIFDLSALASGQYLLTVSSANEIVKTFNVQKID